MKKFTPFAMVILLTSFFISCSKDSDSKTNTLVGTKWKSDKYKDASGKYITEEITFFGDNDKEGAINYSVSESQFGSVSYTGLNLFTYTTDGENVTMNIEEGSQTRTGKINKGISLVLKTNTGVDIYLAKQYCKSYS